MISDEILKSFDVLMKRKHEKKISGSWEAKAYRGEARRLKEHFQFLQSYERCNNNE